MSTPIENNTAALEDLLEQAQALPAAPSGTINITENGTHNVSAYASANVNVSGITPTGNIQLTQQSGTNVTNYATASVRSGSVTLNTPTVNSSGLVTASASVGTTGWVGSAPANKTLQLTTQAAKTVTPSTSQQTAVAAGVYTTGAVTVAAMPSGTAGTPTATKGTVSNNQITITPSVTNTTGYITGGTKTGTAVTVKASDLVSGSQTKTANGTYDVTNLASLVVAIPTYDGSVS